jgi:hypothetical protein
MDAYRTFLPPDEDVEAAVVRVLQGEPCDAGGPGWVGCTEPSDGVRREEATGDRGLWFVLCERHLAHPRAAAQAAAEGGS